MAYNSGTVPKKMGIKFKVLHEGTRRSDIVAIYTKDRMQVLANYSDGSDSVGETATSTVSLTVLLFDINPDYVENDLGGYPEVWTGYDNHKMADRLGSQMRFAFKYLGTDAGIKLLNGENANRCSRY